MQQPLSDGCVVVLPRDFLSWCYLRATQDCYESKTIAGGRIIMIATGIRKVMVVDDDSSMRNDCKQILVENGLDVAEAVNGIEAVSVYSDVRPDMVFMKITMPDMDSLTALQEIMAIDSNAKVAVAVVKGQQASVLVALKLGAVDFVIKPFCQEQILCAIDRALGLAQIDRRDPSGELKIRNGRAVSPRPVMPHAGGG